MRISEISLSNFRNHLTTRIIGLARVNVVVGPNGAGKSSILDAIGYALTGTCRGVDDGGRGAEALATQVAGAPKQSTAVSLRTDRGDITRALNQGPRSQAHVKIVTKLGLDERILRVLAAPLNLLRLPTRKQEEVFFSLTGSSVPDEKIRAALTEAGVHPGLAPEPSRLATPEGRAEYLGYLKTRRVELKRERDSLVYAPGERQLPTADVPKRVGLEAKRHLLSQKVSEAVGAANQHLSTKRHLGEMIAREESELARIPDGYPAPLGKTQEADIRGQIERRREIEKEIAGLTAEHRGLKTQAQEIVRQIEQVQALGAECSECGQRIDKQHQLGRANALVGSSDALTKKGAVLKAKIDALQRDANAIDTGDLLQKLNKSEQAKADIERADRDVKRLKASLQDLVRRRDELKAGQSNESWLAESKDALTTYDEEIALLREAEGEESRRASINTSRIRIEDDLAQIELLVKALGPGGVIQQLMASAGTDRLVESVQSFAQRMGVGQLTIDLAPWTIRLNGRPIELASASEEFRVAAAFGMAFARQAGASIVCLDGAEILFGEYRELFEELLFECGLEQVFVAATKDEIPEDAPSIDGLAFYGVTKAPSGAAQVNRITAKEAIA